MSLLAELKRRNECEFAAKAPFREDLCALPQFELLHQDPRFHAMLEPIGLPPNSARGTASHE